MSQIQPLQPPFAEPQLAAWPGIDPALMPQAIALRDWLVSETKTLDPADFLRGFADRLRALRVPVDRIFTALEALHSEYAGIGRTWTFEEGVKVRLLPHGERRDEVYRASPLAYANRTGEWLMLDVADAPDNCFPIVMDLKAAGYTQYIAAPVSFTSGTENGISFATRAPEGFGAHGLAILRFILPTLSVVMEMRVLRKRLNDVLRIYVGDEPHRVILSGTIQRGQVSRIRSAILFADMRDYTRTTSALSPEAAVDLLNALFDCLVPPIEAEGGEVLKYLGDGLLAIFRDRGDDTGGAAQSALTAAINGLVRIEAANAEGRFPRPISVGVALHHGEAAYGNVGSGQRLDFTVIGPDVNLASRIAGLNKTLGEPLLMSKAFVEHLWGDPEPLGPHEVEGLDDKVEVYRVRSS